MGKNLIKRGCRVLGNVLLLLCSVGCSSDHYDVTYGGGTLPGIAPGTVMKFYGDVELGVRVSPNGQTMTNVGPVQGSFSLYVESGRIRLISGSAVVAEIRRDAITEVSVGDVFDHVMNELGLHGVSDVGAIPEQPGTAVRPNIGIIWADGQKKQGMVMHCNDSGTIRFNTNGTGDFSVTGGVYAAVVALTRDKPSIRQVDVGGTSASK